MPSLVPLARGFTADLRYEVTTSRRRRHHIPAAAVVLGLLISVVLLIQILPGNKSTESTESNKSLPSVTANPYQWRVYMLNQSSVLEQTSGTAFSFRTEDLPFSFDSILFGDFRADVDHQATYYGGCGILVNASGNPASVVLRERTGEFIASVQYAGQELIVFSGERRSVSYPTASTSYHGTDMLVEDWRNGTWSPNDGILIEHPGNVTVTESVFCFMVFEPAGGVMVPEFSSLATIVIIVLISMIIALRFGDGRQH